MCAATSQSPGHPDLYFKIVCDPGHERTTRELKQLPKESRERVWADMTGDPAVCPDQAALKAEQDPQHIMQLLEQMNAELAEVKDNEVWSMAMQTKLANDPEFRVLFLRAEQYDPQNAAQRMVRHFDSKIALFGKEKLGRPIQLKDLSGDDLESLSCGGFQFLPRADRAGRLVFMSRYRNFVYKERENMMRALWYMLMSVLENPNARNVGLVVVGYEVGDYVPVDNDMTRQMLRLCRTMPIKFVAGHTCYDETPMRKVTDLLVHMISSFFRLRYRMHCGSHQECRYRLMTMGIPVDYLPVSMTGALSTENHKHWLQYRIQQEQPGPVLPPPQSHSPRVGGFNVIENEDMEM